MLKRSIAVLAAGLALTATINLAQARELAFGVFVPAASPTVQKVYQPWVDWFNEVGAKHDVTIKLYPGGTLGRNPAAQAELVRDGVADLTITVPSYTPGVYPDYDVFELPGFAKNTAEGSQAALEMQQEGLLKGYDDFYVVAMYTSDSYMIHSKKPVASVADIAGQRIRVGGQIQTQVVEALGGVAQDMGAGEMAEAIDRGLIDGALTDASVAKTFRVTDVAKHHFAADLGVLVFAIVMNKGVYEGLPQPVKDRLAESGRFIVDRQIDSYGKAVEANTAAWASDSEHTLTIPDDAEKAKIAEAVQPVIERVSKSASPGLVDAYVKKLEDIRGR